MAAGTFEFSYNTPTPGTDGSGNPITVDVPTTFTLGGIDDTVARGIRAGLRKVTTINNVAVSQIVQNRQSVTGPDPV